VSAPIRLGLIGCGRAAERLHVPAIGRATATRLAGVFDPIRSRRELIASRQAGCHAFESAESLVYSGEIDAVIVATPAEDVAEPLGRHWRGHQAMSAPPSLPGHQVEVECRPAIAEGGVVIEEGAKGRASGVTNPHGTLEMQPARPAGQYSVAERSILPGGQGDIREAADRLEIRAADRQVAAGEVSGGPIRPVGWKVGELKQVVAHRDGV
jgi:hypothetical protein